MSDDPEEKDGIYRLQTVPPPDGESDVYNAPTKVGPMATSVIQELIEQAQRAGGVVEGQGATKAIDTSKIAPAMPPPPAVPRPSLEKRTPVETFEPVDLPPPPPLPAGAIASPPIPKLDIAELVSQEEAALSDADRAQPTRSSNPAKAASTPPVEPAPLVTARATEDAPITNAELGKSPHTRLVVIGAVLVAVVVVVWVVATKLMP